VRVYALSDVHVDYDANARWIEDLSQWDYCDDILLLAGDVSDDLLLLDRCLTTLTRRFHKVLFVPGNHDLWVTRRDLGLTSMEKLDAVARVAVQCGVSISLHRAAGVTIVPLLSWYDYSFGPPCDELRDIWTDFIACRWPDGVSVQDVATHFLSLNFGTLPQLGGGTVITFSHFLPRADLVPMGVPPHSINLHPVLGTSRLDVQLRQLGAGIHIYGHSHVSRNVEIDGVTYINNALGYPREEAFASRILRCVYEV